MRDIGLVERLRKRAEIRRQISTRKSVQEGKADRIADLLEEAASELDRVKIERREEMLRYNAQRIAELESQCAAMREALLSRCPAHCDADHEAGVCELTRRQVEALAPDAGKAPLERLERAERDATGWRAAMNVHAERADHARALALEDAAKVAEDIEHRRWGNSVASSVGLKFMPEIAAAIRALKDGGT